MKRGLEIYWNNTQTGRGWSGVMESLDGVGQLGWRRPGPHAGASCYMIVLYNYMCGLVGCLYI